MEIKKSPKADLEGKKGVFFEIGLTLALAVLLFAFEWKSSAQRGQTGNIAVTRCHPTIHLRALLKNRFY